MSWRVLELFSGIGGWSFALGGRGVAVAAYDIDRLANETYALNHGRRPHTRELAKVDTAELAGHTADTWLLSPPCQPYCRMGQGLDLADRRSAGLRRLLDLLGERPPERLVLENVPGFLGSQAHRLLVERLDRHGFDRRELELCPTAFGIPNRRPRVFVVAARRALSRQAPPAIPLVALAGFLDAAADPACEVPAQSLQRHWQGLDLVHPEDRRSACFIGGYGQRYVGSGSFLRTAAGARRFSPAEVARLLGLPALFRFPPGLSAERCYRQLGNGLSIPVASWVLSLLPD